MKWSRLIPVLTLMAVFSTSVFAAEIGVRAGPTTMRKKSLSASRPTTIPCHPERSEGPGGAGARCSILEPPHAQVPRYARDDSRLSHLHAVKEPRRENVQRLETLMHRTKDLFEIRTDA